MGLRHVLARPFRRRASVLAGKSASFLDGACVGQVSDSNFGLLQITPQNYSIYSDFNIRLTASLMKP
jgi:hypothetical protein